MRRALPLFLGALILTFSFQLSAENFDPTIDEPKSYREAMQGVKELKENIHDVQCGGWGEESLSGRTGPAFPEVTGVPGRTNIAPPGDIRTGKAVRSTFEYPQNGQTGSVDDVNDNSGAWGFITACDIHNHNLQIATEPPEYIDINPESLCIKENGVDKRTPAQCKRLYEQLRALSAQYNNRQDTCGARIQYCFSIDLGHTRECAGNDCRTSGIPAFQYTPNFCVPTPTGLQLVRNASIDTLNKASFYRHYDIDVKGPPPNEWKPYGECYDYYNEIEPRTEITDEDDEQCEINMNTGSSPWPQWEPQQKQKGLYKPDPPITDAPKEERQVSDPWKADPETNLSLLDMEKVREMNAGRADEDDIFRFLHDELPVKQQAGKVTPDSKADPFDDTASESDPKKSVWKWWESQQQEFAKLTREPGIKLILPSRLLLGLDPDDPLFRFGVAAPSQSNGITEVTIHAAPEELGAVLGSLQYSTFLTPKPVRIPILVPLLSETEANSRITEWKLWGVQYGKSSEVEPYIQKIEEYRDAAKEVTLLRQALPTYLAKTFSTQRTLKGFFANWYLKNAERLRVWQQIATARTNIKNIWEDSATALLEASECQLQWCSNQRYDIKIFSLNDGWLPGTARDNGQLPDLKDLNPPYQVPKEVIIDFSQLTISGSQLYIPELWPIQVRPEIPLPPFGGTPLPNIADFPEIPTYSATSYADMFGDFSAPQIAFPQGIRLIDEESLQFAIDDRYLIPVPETPHQTLANATIIALGIKDVIDGDDRGSLKGAYCRYAKSVNEPPRDDEGLASRIVHVESDFKERVARLYARYMPLMPEDFEGRNQRLDQEYGRRTNLPCNGNEVCEPLTGEDKRSFRWSLIFSLPEQGFATLYNALRDATVPQDEKDNPYLGATVKTLQRLFLPETPPIPFDLLL